jgi:cell division protein ZapA
MAQVSVTVNGRRYDISCDDGQETHVFRLAEEVDRRVAQLVASVGHVGDARLLLLASLLLADQMEDLRKELAGVRVGAAAGGAVGSEAAANAGEALGEALRGLAERIEAMAESIDSASTIAGQPGPG